MVPGIVTQMGWPRNQFTIEGVSGPSRRAAEGGLRLFFWQSSIWENSQPD